MVVRIVNHITEKDHQYADESCHIHSQILIKSYFCVGYADWYVRHFELIIKNIIVVNLRGYLMCCSK